MVDVETSYRMDLRTWLRAYAAAYPAQAATDVVAPLVLLFGTLVLGSRWQGVVLAIVVPLICRRLVSTYRLSGSDELHARLSDDGVHISGGHVASSRMWRGYTWATRRWGFWVLRSSPFHRVAIPVTALDESQTRRLLDFLRENDVPVRRGGGSQDDVRGPR